MLWLAGPVSGLVRGGHQLAFPCCYGESGSKGRARSGEVGGRRAACSSLPLH